MSRPEIQSNIIRCNQCQYEGPGKSNSTFLFMVLVVFFLSSAYFLPMIIVALGYMTWLMTRPAKFVCPQCKAGDVAKLAETHGK